MASKREKARKARAERNVQKFAGYKRRADGCPDERTKYGKRWWARRRGQPMKARKTTKWSRVMPAPLGDPNALHVELRQGRTENVA